MRLVVLCVEATCNTCDTQKISGILILDEYVINIILLKKTQNIQAL